MYKLQFVNIKHSASVFFFFLIPFFTVSQITGFVYDKNQQPITGVDVLLLDINLKDGNGTMPVLEIPMPDITNDAKTKIQLRIFVFSLLNFIINPDIITKIVGRRIASPAYPIMNVEVLSIIKENSINDVENVGAAHKMKLSLFFMNGNEK